MLSQLWSNAQQDPPLTLALLLCLAVVAAWLVTFLAVILEGRQVRITTAAKLREDAFTAERRARLKLRQSCAGTRKAS